MLFPEITKLSPVALNILKKRYFQNGETTWEELVDRVCKHVVGEFEQEEYSEIREMILNRYFLPNSPCLVNAGTRNGGLAACFVVDFPDTMEGIYKTKLDFALIAKKGGGAGTTLSKLRPKNAVVNGSAHGYAGGPIDFYNTICKDMEVITQAGFRSMAMMGTMSVYHPDILLFLSSKENEGVMSTTNISVVVEDEFMKAVIEDKSYKTYFDFESGRVFYNEYKARDIFNLIVEGTWRNGEPGLLFYDKINDSPYKYSKQEIMATNPCGEQPLPFNGVCNLGSMDLAKFLDKDNELNLNLLEIACRFGIRFLDNVVTKTVFPTEDINNWAMQNRPVGLGVMGFADYCLKRKIAYGSQQSLDELEFILSFMYKIAEDESIELGEKYGVPEKCSVLPVPRRNITLLTVAPTGTVSLIAGCNSGIEPVFSEITIRNDKTGSYKFDHDLASKPYFRCAVSANGGQEVTWEEHVKVQASAQKFVDAGVSKTINFPSHTKRETIYNAFILAWQLGCKGITCYRNGSRKVEVLSPQALKKDKCPLCESDLLTIDGKKKCSNPECTFVFK
jgi:ribonucleoside-diphosphate reductase alpha chain